jgi:hypothetical protein
LAVVGQNRTRQKHEMKANQSDGTANLRGSNCTDLFLPINLLHREGGEGRAYDACSCRQPLCACPSGTQDRTNRLEDKDHSIVYSHNVFWKIHQRLDNVYPPAPQSEKFRRVKNSSSIPAKSSKTACPPHNPNSPSAILLVLYILDVLRVAYSSATILPPKFSFPAEGGSENRT